MSIQDLIDEIVQAVPDYDAFLSVDEMAASTAALVAAHPDIVRTEVVGHSRAGDEITAVTIGHGAKNALMFAMPHPNEPIGSMTLEYLLTQLVSNTQLRERFDYTWTLIKCVDPDGARLNEGWFKGPFTATQYARHFYRPPGYLQVEWTFPIAYKDLVYDAPLPETEALMKMIERLKPEFIYSLHNAGFGGVYLYMSGELDGFAEPFYRLVENERLPLHLGEPEMPMLRTIAPAIFNLPSTAEIYDFLAENGTPDPAALLTQGGSSFEYAERFCDPSVLICEMPYWYSPAIDDTTPADMTRREAVLQGVAAERAFWAEIRPIVEAVKPHLTAVNPFAQAVITFMEQSAGLDATEAFAKNNPDFEQMATVAEKFDSFTVSKFYDLLVTGMLVRMIAMQLELTPEVAELQAQYGRAVQKFEQDTADFEATTPYDQIPIQKLVRVQVGTALLNMSLIS